MSAKRYPGERVEVSFDPQICQHAAECVRGLPAVFDTSKRPWINPDAAEADDVIEVVGRCPSGALQITRAGPADPAPAPATD